MCIYQNIMSEIYYDGIGSYKDDHMYNIEEFIILCNKNKDNFNHNYKTPYPELSPYNYTTNDLDHLILWTGAKLSETFCDY